MKNIVKKQDGFTLIETMVAMVIFTIGILALFGMQSAAIKENLVANSVTTGATLASAKVEELIADSYANAHVDGNYKTCSVFSSSDWWIDGDTDPEIGFIKYEGETANQPDYFVYWAVSRDCTLVKEGDVGLEDDSEYRPKHLYIVVTRDSGNGEEVTAEFSYIKQNPDY